MVRATAGGPVIDTVFLSNGVFNGVILGAGRVNVQGTLDGKLTIASVLDLYIQNDIVYEKDPMAGASDDLLGLVAGDNVVVADNAANNSDCVIQGAIFAKDVAFTAENYVSRGISGKLTVLGSIIQKERGEVAKMVEATSYRVSTNATGTIRGWKILRFAPPISPGTT